MAWTQTDLDALEKAIGKGVKSVTYQSGTVVYQSLDDMLKIRGLMVEAISGQAPVTRSVAAYDNGLSRGFLFQGWRRW